MKYKVGDRVCLSWKAMAFGFVGLSFDLIEKPHRKLLIKKAKLKAPFMQQRYALSDGSVIPERFIKPIITLKAELG